MTREAVVETLIEFAAMAFGKETNCIKEDTVIAEELGQTSNQRVAMSASIENEYDVMIPVARFGNYRTIGDLADFIMEEI